jgi:hypothetical protein
MDRGPHGGDHHTEVTALHCGGRRTADTQAMRMTVQGIGFRFLLYPIGCRGRESRMVPSAGAQKTGDFDAHRDIYCKLQIYCLHQIS